MTIRIRRKINREIGTTGHRETINLCGWLGDDVLTAIGFEHDCSDVDTCDIAHAVENGFPLTAGYLLSGATETPLLDAVYAAYRIDPHRASLREWDAWSAHFAEHATRCDACNGSTFDVEDDDRCGHCGAPFDRPDGFDDDDDDDDDPDPTLPDGYAVGDTVRVDGYSGIAFRISGARDGRIIAHMVGDDRAHTLDVDDVHKLDDSEYCAECGQIGCGWHTISEDD